jgi:hypothetical protein
MPKRLRLVAVPLIAGTMIALTTASVWAFTQQNLAPNGNYDFNYGSLDNKDKANKNPFTSDPKSPGLHFSVEHGQTGPFGFHSFGNDKYGPPDFSRPVGNGD